MNDDGWARELQAQIDEWKLSIRRLTVERRAKDRLLRIAEKRLLRAGRITGVVSANGNRVDFNQSGENDLKTRLAQIDYELETLEVMIEEAEAEIAMLPDDVQEAPEAEVHG